MRYFTPKAKFKFLQNPMSMKKNKSLTQKPANYRQFIIKTIKSCYKLRAVEWWWLGFGDDADGVRIVSDFGRSVTSTLHSATGRPSGPWRGYG